MNLPTALSPTICHARDENKEPYYLMSHFKVYDFTATRFSSSMNNILSQIRGLLIKAIQEQRLLPKAILMVLDDNIIKQYGITNNWRENFQHIIYFLLLEIDRNIKNYKAQLPTKCKEEYFPHIIWMLPPCHKFFANNRSHQLFCNVMESEVENFTSMCCLRLKKIWDENEGAFFLQEQRRYTPEGLHAYWLAIDASIKFWHKTLSEILTKKQKKSVFQLKANRAMPLKPPGKNRLVRPSHPLQHHKNTWAHRHHLSWEVSKD